MHPEPDCQVPEFWNDWPRGDGTFVHLGASAGDETQLQFNEQADGRKAMEKRTTKAEQLTVAATDMLDIAKRQTSSEGGMESDQKCDHQSA